jgi:hypothetical protein
MALEEYGESNGTYLKIKHSCICQESKTEKDGYKKVEGTLKDGTPWKKWIRPYKAVSGYVDKIERYDREHEGRKFRGWNITINDEGTRYFLDIPFDSRVNGRWMKLAESIDYNKPVRFSAWHDKKSDSTALNVQQDGVSVPQKYTREEPNGLPEPIQRSSGKWDYGAQEDFLVERLIKFVIPNVELVAANRNGVGEPQSNRNEPESHETEIGGPAKNVRRLIKALAGTKAVDEASAETLMEQYFGTTKWEEVEKLPESFLTATAKRLDDLIPF